MDSACVFMYNHICATRMRAKHSERFAAFWFAATAGRHARKIKREKIEKNGNNNNKTARNACFASKANGSAAEYGPCRIGTFACFGVNLI